MDFDVIDFSEINVWEKKVSAFPEKFNNIYLLPEYYATWKEYENAEPHLAFLQDDDLTILYPFFKKKIEGYDLNKDYYDIFTAYGYGGVLSSSGKPPDIKVQEMFNRWMNRWCQANSVVTEFIREMPLANYRIRWADYSLVRYNTGVAADTKYHIPCKKTRSHIRNAEWAGVTTSWDHDLATIDNFIEMYGLTAERLGFSYYYSFPDAYFHSVKHFLADHTSILNVHSPENEILASGMVFIKDKKASFHLACSKDTGEHLNQNDVMFGEVIRYCLEAGCEFICLGGGTTPDIHDSLLRFKRKFGNTLLPVYIGKAVHDQATYDLLIKSWESEFAERALEYPHYFQRYKLRYKA